MNRSTVFLLLATMALAIGCADNSNATTSTSTGTGGGLTTSSTSTSTATATSSTSTGGGTGGSGDETVGLQACPFGVQGIGPILGETTTPDGIPINEHGGVAPHRIVPPTTPWTVTDFTYGAAKGLGPCVDADHSALVFVGPATGDLPDTWTSAVEIPVVGASLPWDGNFAVVSIHLPIPIVLHEGEAFIYAPKFVASKSERSCLLACDGLGADPDSFYSVVNALGTIDPCPEQSCKTQLLSVSPDPQTAHQYGNDDRAWLGAMTGHAGG